MKSLYLFATGLAVLLSSCSASKNQTPQGSKKKTEITGVRPNVKTPSKGVINASGDALTPGVNSLNRSGAGSEENATLIANNAITRANAGLKNPQIKLDTINGPEFLDRVRAVESKAAKTNSTALEKSADSKIKTYAEVLIKDHRQLKEDLEKIKPGSKNEEIIIATLQLLNASPKQPAAAKNKDNTSPDAEYIQNIIQDHQNLIRILEAGSRSKDPAISSFSLKYLPVFKQHLTEAQELTKRP